MLPDSIALPALVTLLEWVALSTSLRVCAPKFSGWSTSAAVDLPVIFETDQKSLNGTSILRITLQACKIAPQRHSANEQVK